MLQSMAAETIGEQKIIHIRVCAQNGVVVQQVHVVVARPTAL